MSKYHLHYRESQFQRGYMETFLNHHAVREFIDVNLGPTYEFKVYKLINITEQFMEQNT